VKASTKRHIENGAASGLVLVAVGLRVGFWLVDHVAAIRKLWHTRPAGSTPAEELDGAA
jgi:hypothetical protein